MGEVATTLIGVVCGFLLASIWEWLAGHRKERSRNNAVRRLVSLEIDENTNRLKELWSAVTKNREMWINDEADAVWSSLAKEIAGTPLAKPGKDSWNAVLPSIPNAFQADQLNKLWKKYENFEQIWLLHQHLVQLDQERVQETRHKQAQLGRSTGVVMGRMLGSLRHSQYAIPVVEVFVEKLREVLGSREVDI